MCMTSFETTSSACCCRNLDNDSILHALLKTIILGCQLPKLPLEIKTLSPLTSYIKSHSNNDDKIPHNKALKFVTMMFQ